MLAGWCSGASAVSASIAPITASSTITGATPVDEREELFGAFRHAVSTAEEGASVCFAAPTYAPKHVDEPPDPNVVDRAVDA